MRQIRESSIMEIDITNACQHRCSNCTRFCGHHQKPFFMDYDTFCRAIDSLEGYQGWVSAIGGEPLLHPDYNRFAAYMRAAGRDRITQTEHGAYRAVVKDPLVYARERKWFQGAMNRGRGYLLFTSMPRNYCACYESIDDTIGYLMLNDHTEPSFHQPILVSRKDLGISDDEFAKLRENCWLQNFWSATITPKGAFFCEIAGTLDMLFNGPGGKPIEPGWWEKDLSEFRDQFHWCDICGMALTTYSRNANEELDDASPTLMEKLRAAGSPRLLREKRVLPLDMGNRYARNGSISADMGSVQANYQPVYEKRSGSSVEFLRPEAFLLGITVFSEDELKKLSAAAVSLPEQADGILAAVWTRFAPAAERILAENGCKNSRVISVDDSVAAIGAAASILLQAMKGREWLILSENGCGLPREQLTAMRGCCLNPGYFFVMDASYSIAVCSPAASALRVKGRDALADCRSVRAVAALWGDKLCRWHEGLEKEPDTNIVYFRERIREEFLSDLALRERLSRQLLAQNACEGSNILLLQSAYIYMTLGIYHILKALGYQISVVSSRNFESYFRDVVPAERLFLFEEESFQYERQAELRDRVRDSAAFRAAVVPFSFGAGSVKPIDNYGSALRTAEKISGAKPVIVNIRRELIRPEYDIWEETSDA